MDIKTVLFAFAILMILEALALIIFPNQIRKAFSRLIKNKYSVRWTGLIEMIIGILIIIVVTIFYSV